MGVDAFTEALRWCIWLGLGICLMIALGLICGCIAQRWMRRRQLSHSTPEEQGEHAWHQESHVHLIDQIPEEWLH